MLLHLSFSSRWQAPCSLFSQEDGGERGEVSVVRRARVVSQVWQWRWFIYLGMPLFCSFSAVVGVCVEFVVSKVLLGSLSGIDFILPNSFIECLPF